MKEKVILGDQDLGKIGSTVLRIAVLAAAALIVLAAVWLIASVVQRQTCHSGPGQMKRQ
jgi:hypothetical protein